MKKYIKAIIGICILASIVVFFIIRVENIDNNSTVEIWWYEYEKEHTYNSIIAKIVNVAVYSLNNQGIPAREVKYSYKDMTYSDYVFKRNIALSTKDAFTLDDSKSLYSLKEYYGDYSKIENYVKGYDFPMFRDKYCIPIGIYSKCFLANIEIFNHYNVNIDMNKLYTYVEFLELKQALKEKGAKFNLNRQEYYYTMDYYIDKNDLYSADLFDPKYVPEVEYRHRLKNTILEIYNDLNSYYDDAFNYDIIAGNSVDKSVVAYDNQIHDTSSMLQLSSTYSLHPFQNNDYTRARTEFDNKIPVLMDGYFMTTGLKNPCIFIYNRDHNENVYKAANELLTNVYYELAMPRNMYGGRNLYYLPVSKSEFTYRSYEVNGDFVNDSYLTTLAKLGHKEIAKQVRLMNVITSNIMTDSQAQEVIAKSFSRDGSLEYLHNFIIEELGKLYENESYLDKIDDSVYSYTRNYYIRIK